MSIYPASRTDAEQLARIISQANKDVAQQFGLNASNAPNHPSFCTSDWVRSDFDRGERYFFYHHQGKPVGCVAYEKASEETIYLNRLSVLPDWRHQRIGHDMVTFVLAQAREQGASKVSVGIIADHTLLLKWYQSQGFTRHTTRRFEHLPFDVTYLHYDLTA
ncbi:MAG: GNAT family N-acetyltransferase [Marinobacterium sp.]|nr:GNAT family N-acetyltransferase [Marinobacterium sp.]